MAGSVGWSCTLLVQNVSLDCLVLLRFTLFCLSSYLVILVLVFLHIGVIQYFSHLISQYQNILHVFVMCFFLFHFPSVSSLLPPVSPMPVMYKLLRLLYLLVPSPTVTYPHGLFFFYSYNVILRYTFIKRPS